ncbi:MAG TPA: CBS domain-containing protein [Bacteroidetes bacterium]|nr:CBS domain-containing protein [Bacteroidota bacterium]
MKKMTAQDIMNKNIIVVPQNWTITELARFFLEKAITGAPVADREGKLVGVVSLMDIARYESYSARKAKPEKTHHYYLHGWEDAMDSDDMRAFHVEDYPDTTVEQIMTPMIFKVPAEMAIPDVARMMVMGRIHRVLVVDEDKPVGIITTMDLLKLLY